MSREVLVFNLPPLETCVPTPWCREWCYALRRRHLFPQVKASQARHLEESKRPDFVGRAISEIKVSKKRYVRIHSAGDFYSDNYVFRWARIVEACPDRLFRSTTKRRDLWRSLPKLAALPNMVLRESLDPSRTEPSGILDSVTLIEGMRLVTPHGEALVHRCVDDCKACGFWCWHNTGSIVVPKV